MLPSILSSLPGPHFPGDTFPLPPEPSLPISGQVSSGEGPGISASSACCVPSVGSLGGTVSLAAPGVC